MNRSWFRKLATLVVGLAAVVAFTMSNAGCSSCKKCGAGCDKPCCKKADHPKGEHPKKEEPKKEEAKKP